MLMLEVRKKRNPEELAELIIETGKLDRFVKQKGGGKLELAFVKAQEVVKDRYDVKISREEGKRAAKE